MSCRHCHSTLDLVFCDLGSSPPSNSLLTPEQRNKPEVFFPLLVKVCQECWLVQTQDFANREELFSPEYTYFSSFSTTFIDHSRNYVDKISRELGLGSESFVVEVASNDGYLLQFVKEAGIPCLGIEPTASTAAVSKEKEIPTISEFFGVSLAEKLLEKGSPADLTIANNVLAHVPDINDFVKGFTTLLANDGVATFEFPHLLTLVDQVAFDTIYHEHYSYLSLFAIDQVFQVNGLSVFDVEEIPTHGGSLRVYAQRTDTGQRMRTSAVEALLKRELDAGVNTSAYYEDFQRKVAELKNRFLQFLLDHSDEMVIGYGAAAKANTLINYAGVRPDLIQFVVDRNPNKYGKFLPGSKIPVLEEEEISRLKPGFIIIFPWNIKQEIIEQLAYAGDWGAKFVTFMPDTEITA